MRELRGVSFIRALIPFRRAPPSGPKHLPKALPPNITVLGIRISTCELWGGRGQTHSVSSKGHSIQREQSVQPQQRGRSRPIEGLPVLDLWVDHGERVQGRGEGERGMCVFE